MSQGPLGVVLVAALESIALYPSLHLPVVHVKIDYCHAPYSLLPVQVTCVGCGDGHVVEQAKAMAAMILRVAFHHPSGSGMVPGRPHRTKRVAVGSSHDAIDRQASSPRCPQGR